MKATKIGNKSIKAGILTIILMSMMSLSYASGIYATIGFSNKKGLNTGEKVADSRIKNSTNLSGKERLSLDVEEELVVESWMVDIKDRSWKQDVEEEQTLENWMFETENTILNTEEQEEEIIIENWMSDPGSWLN
jgi:hypothetical protein